MFFRQAVARSARRSNRAPGKGQGVGKRGGFSPTCPVPQAGPRLAAFFLWVMSPCRQHASHLKPLRAAVGPNTILVETVGGVSFPCEVVVGFLRDSCRILAGSLRDPCGILVGFFRGSGKIRKVPGKCPETFRKPVCRKDYIPLHTIT